MQLKFIAYLVKVAPFMLSCTYIYTVSIIILWAGQFCQQSLAQLFKPLATVFNRSLLQGYFPSTWKDANVTAIHKKEDKSVPSNYNANILT